MYIVNHSLHSSILMYASTCKLAYTNDSECGRATMSRIFRFVEDYVKIVISLR